MLVDLYFVKRIKLCLKNYLLNIVFFDYLLILRKVISWNKIMNFNW